MSKTKIGRNDPCPCGSGKKYKNCCIALNQEAELDLFTRYNQTIANVKLKLDEEFRSGIKKIRKDAQQDFLRFTVNKQLSSEHEALFSDWLWFDMRDSEGDTMTCDYLRKHGEYMPERLQECLQALSISYLSVYEPIASGNELMDVQDLFSGLEDRIILKEALDMNVQEKPLLLLGRLVAFPEGKVFSGMVLLMENNAGQADYIRDHINYLQTLHEVNNSEDLLKANTQILYGVFDHAYHKKLMAINDIRTLKLDPEERRSFQNILDLSDQVAFVHDIDKVRWYEEIDSPAYRRIGLGEDYAVSFVSKLEDLHKWDEILGNNFPILQEWQMVNCRFLRQAPPEELLPVWYQAIRDQETERWLQTPHRELSDQTPLEQLAEAGGRQKVLQLLDSFAVQLATDHEGQDLIDYMRRRIQKI